MLQIESVYKQYSTRVLLEGASAHLRPNSRVGLVGPNGAGKTTLFRMIVGEETPDEGDVSVPKRLTIGYFRQDMGEMKGRSVIDEAIADVDYLLDKHRSEIDEEKVLELRDRPADQQIPMPINYFFRSLAALGLAREPGDLTVGESGFAADLGLSVKETMDYLRALPTIIKDNDMKDL